MRTAGNERHDMKYSQLVGLNVELIVHGTPCRCIGDGFEILTETTSGRIERFIQMPGGHIGVLLAEDGRRILFDAFSDIKNGTVEIAIDKEGADGKDQ